MRGWDAFLKFAVLWIGLLLVTGGLILKTRIGKIEFSSLDPWVLGFAVLLGIRLWISDRPTALASWWKKGFAACTRTEGQSRRLLGVFALVFGALALAHLFRHLGFETAIYDHACIHQPLWNAFSNPLLKCDTCVGGSYLGEHLSFVFFLVALVVKALGFLLMPLQGPNLSVFLLQAFLTGWMLWLLVRKGPLEKKPELWIFAAIILLCFRGVRASVVWDFREDLIAGCGFAIALVSYGKQRWWLYSLGLAIAVLSKENMGLVIAVLGISIALDRSRVRVGIATIALGLAATVIAFKFLIPHFSAGAESENNIVRRFPGLGTTTAQVLMGLVTNPGTAAGLFLPKIFSFGAFKYLVLLLGPVLAFGCRSFLGWLPALSLIAMNLLSDAPTQRSLQFHYELAMTPFLAFAVLEGMARTPMSAIRGRLGIVALLLALGTSGRWPGAMLSRYFPTAQDTRASFCLSRVPDLGITMSSVATLPQISHLRSVRHFQWPADAGDRSGKQLWNDQFESLPNTRARFSKEDFSKIQAIVLDLEQPLEKKLSDDRERIDFHEVFACGENRFRILKRD